VRAVARTRPCHPRGGSVPRSKSGEPLPGQDPKPGSRTRRSAIGAVDPLYRIRKLLLTGEERLDDEGRNRLLLSLRIGDPHDDVLGGWLSKEPARDAYLTDDPKTAALLLDKAIAGCTGDILEEIRSLETRSPPGERRSSPTTPPVPATAAPKGSPLRETRQAVRARLQALRVLQAPSAPPHRRCDVAEASLATSDQNALSPLRSVGPYCAGVGSLVGRHASRLCGSELRTRH
jgi:hypothetical protein